MNTESSKDDHIRDNIFLGHNWRESKASETLSGLFNRESRIYTVHPAC